MTGMNMLNATPRTVFLKDYAPPPYLVESIDLDIHIHPGYTSVGTTLSVKRNPDASGVGTFELNGEELELESVWLDGRKLCEALAGLLRQAGATVAEHAGVVSDLR